MNDEFFTEQVKPFYLGMMGLNGIQADADRIADIRAAGANVSVDEVHDLLRSDWRPRVMGAWYALLHDPHLVTEELGQSMATSAGTLTAPPLATVAALLLGEAALPSLSAYATAAAANSYLGADGYVAAAMEYVGGTGLVPPTEQDREDLALMLAVAEGIRG